MIYSSQHKKQAGRQNCPQQNRNHAASGSALPEVNTTRVFLKRFTHMVIKIEE